MVSQLRVGRLLGVAGLTAFLFVATTNPANAVFICAGADWPDTSASATDTLSSFSSHGTLIPVPGGPVFPPMSLPVLTGPAKIFRAAGTPPGHIDTEMVSLTLTGSGFTLLAGDGTGPLPLDLLDTNNLLVARLDGPIIHDIVA